jgi:hypothetical protein
VAAYLGVGRSGKQQQTEQDLDAFIAALAPNAVFQGP